VIDSSYNWIGFLLVATVTLVVGIVAARRPGSRWPERLLLAAVALRVIGSIVRYEIIFQYYGGGGDAILYFRMSLPMAEDLQSFELSPFTLSFWGDGGRFDRWWGTIFLEKVSALVLAVIGPTLRGEFLAFSLFAFAGLVATAVAFGRVQPERRVAYASWLWMWPSLWFWPSSVGKEALIVLALGLVTLGYVGTGQRMRWPTLLAGLGLAFCLRPHVAAVAAFATLSAHWLASWERPTPRRLVEAAAVVTLVIVALAGMGNAMGFERPDLENARELMEWTRQNTLRGGSNVGNVPMSISALPLAFVNVWMRPFPWEAHNATALLAATELVALWALVLIRHKSIKLAILNWRQHRMLRIAAPMILFYTILIGLAFGNLGIIARQRTPLFPFVLAFVLAVPDHRQRGAS
jgi:hypothetical protein